MDFISHPGGFSLKGENQGVEGKEGLGLISDFGFESSSHHIVSNGKGGWKLEYRSNKNFVKIPQQTREKFLYPITAPPLPSPSSSYLHHHSLSYLIHVYRPKPLPPPDLSLFSLYPKGNGDVSVKVLSHIYIR